MSANRWNAAQFYDVVNEESTGVILRHGRTGFALSVMCEDVNTHEVYRTNHEKSIQTIMRELGLARDEAIRQVLDATIMKPLVAGHERFWTEL